MDGWIHLDERNANVVSVNKVVQTRNIAPRTIIKVGGIVLSRIGNGWREVVHYVASGRYEEPECFTYRHVINGCSAFGIQETYQTQPRLRCGQQTAACHKTQVSVMQQGKRYKATSPQRPRCLSVKYGRLWQWMLPMPTSQVSPLPCLEPDPDVHCGI